MVPTEINPVTQSPVLMDMPPWDRDETLPKTRVATATKAFVLLGVVLRILRYLTNQPLWGDEAYLAASLIDRDYTGLLEPLEYAQVAPLFFLWSELTAVRWFGFAEWTLRLFPMICGVATVPLFAHLACRTLAPVSALLAVAIFSVAFYPIRHATEVKPYATDLLAALALLTTAIAWWQQSALPRRLWLLAAIGPLAIGFSYPAVFVAAGVGLALLLPIWRMRDRRILVAYIVANVTMATSFILLYLLVIRGQSASAGPGMHRYWLSAFPPSWTEPIRLLGWLIQAHTSRAFAYPIGEANGGSAFTTLLVAVGVMAIWRRGSRVVLMILLSPFLVGLVAAFAGRYPYGGSARTMQYVAPSICLLAALGATRLIGLTASPKRRLRLLCGSLTFLAGTGVATLGADFVRPYKFIQDEQSRRFAQWFWTTQDQQAELVCVKRDLGTTIDGHHWMTGRSAVYLCNRAIHDTRRSSVRLDRVKPDRPLRCVLYNLNRQDPEYASWLRSMRQHYQIARILTYTPVPPTIVGGLKYEDRYDIIEFVPRSEVYHENLAHDGSHKGLTR